MSENQKNVWIKNGKIITENNQIILCDHCPCQSKTYEFLTVVFSFDMDFGEFGNFYTEDKRQNLNMRCDLRGMNDMYYYPKSTYLYERTRS